jgi:hypothetical protein
MDFSPSDLHWRIIFKNSQGIIGKPSKLSFGGFFIGPMN